MTLSRPSRSVDNFYACPSRSSCWPHCGCLWRSKLRICQMIRTATSTIITKARLYFFCSFSPNYSNWFYRVFFLSNYKDEDNETPWWPTGGQWAQRWGSKRAQTMVVCYFSSFFFSQLTTIHRDFFISTYSCATGEKGAEMQGENMDDNHGARDASRGQVCFLLFFFFWFSLNYQLFTEILF